MFDIVSWHFGFQDEQYRLCSFVLGRWFSVWQPEGKQQRTEVATARTFGKHLVLRVPSRVVSRPSLGAGQ